MTGIPKARARIATSRPMRPKPRTPSVRPKISRPAYLLFSHRPWLRSAAALARWRSSASSMPNVISATETVLASGVLRTTTPRASAAARSTLSRPVPARTTTRRSGAPASTSAVTFVALRTSRPCTPFSAVSRSGAPRPLASITSWPASRIRCTAAGSMPSQARTFTSGSRRFPRAPRRLDRARGLPLAQRLGALLERAEDHVDVGEVVGAHVADAQHLPLGVVLAAGNGDAVRVAQALDHRARVHARGRLERGDRVRRALREQRPADRLRARAHRGA